MAEKRGISPVLVVAGGLGLALAGIVALYAFGRAAPPTTGEIALSAGWNEVTYTGSKKKAGIAVQSIASYLEIAYYYDALAGLWKQIYYDTMLEPYMIVNIKVSEDCTWTF